MDSNNILNFMPNLSTMQAQQFGKNINNTNENLAKKDSSKEGSNGINVSTKGGEVKNPSNERSVNNELDKDAFLKLLVTQLQYQNPLEPMDNTQFIAQTAQFSALEQMKNLNTTMTNAQAFNIIGKPVYVETKSIDTGELEALSGVVSSVEIRNGEPYVNIGGKTVPYADVKLVGSIPQSNNSEAINQAMNLIGKKVQAILLSEDLNDATGYIEGNVDFIKFVDGTPVLSVNGKDVQLYEVVSITDVQLIGQEISAETTSGTIKGNISQIIIKNVTEDGKQKSKIFAKVSDKEIEIQDIGSLTTSVSLIGKEIVSGSVNGIVDGIMVRDGKPYLLVGGKEVYHSDVEKVV